MFDKSQKRVNALFFLFISDIGKEFVMAFVTDIHCHCCGKLTSHTGIAGVSLRVEFNRESPIDLCSACFRQFAMSYPKGMNQEQDAVYMKDYRKALKYHDKYRIKNQAEVLAERLAHPSKDE